MFIQFKTTDGKTITINADYILLKKARDAGECIFRSFGDYEVYTIFNPNDSLAEVNEEEYNRIIRMLDINYAE